MNVLDHAIEPLASQCKREPNDPSCNSIQDVRRMSLHRLLNGPDSDPDMFANPSSDRDYDDNDDEIPDEGEFTSGNSPLEEEKRVERSSTGSASPPSMVPSTPQGSLNARERAVCEICKSESGRCHASDPSSMQSFFEAASNFSGVLNSSDWLCMKCYSKWYNRCKRKASSTLAFNLPPPPTSSRKKRMNPKESSVSDSALLLTSIGHWGSNGASLNHSSPAHINSSISSSIRHGSLDGLNGKHRSSIIRDGEKNLEMEIDNIRGDIYKSSLELAKVKNDMAKLQQDFSRKVEQTESMLKFVKSEISSMHDLLKEIADSKFMGLKNTNVNVFVDGMTNPSRGDSKG